MWTAAVSCQCGMCLCVCACDNVMEVYKTMEVRECEIQGCTAVEPKRRTKVVTRYNRWPFRISKTLLLSCGLLFLTGVLQASQDSSSQQRLAQLFFESLPRRQPHSTSHLSTPVSRQRRDSSADENSVENSVKLTLTLPEAVLASERVTRAVISAGAAANRAETQRRTGRDATVKWVSDVEGRSSPQLWRPPDTPDDGLPPGVDRDSRAKSDVSNVLNSIISLLGDNVRLVGPPADRDPNHHANQPRPSRPNHNRPLPTRINNRGPPQFVSIKNRPAVRPYPSQLPPPLRKRPEGGPKPVLPGRPKRPPIAPYANGVPLPEQLVPLIGSPPTPATPKPPVVKTVMTEKVVPTADISNRLPVSSITAEGTDEEADDGTTTTDALTTEQPGPATDTTVRMTTTEEPVTTDEPPTTEAPTPPPATTTEPSIITTTTPAPSESPTIADPELPETTASVPAEATESVTRRPQPPRRRPPPQWVEIPSTPDTSVIVAPSKKPEQPTPVWSSQPTPPLGSVAGFSRPGTVLDDRPSPPRIIQARPDRVRPAVGEVFDITVSAAQGFGGHRPRPPPPRPQQNTAGQSYVIPVDIGDLRSPGDIITQPDAVNTVVSIDGRRTYFDLAPTDRLQTAGTFQTVGASAGSVSRPSWPQRPQQWPQQAAAVRPQWPQQQEVRPPQQQGGRPPQQSRPPPQREPVYTSHRRRPSPPPVQIDTCIVGDDSTCNREHNERCRTEDGVSSCLCRPGFSRLRPRTACKRVVSMVMSVKVDSVGQQRLHWNPSLADPQSEVFQQLAWDAQHAIGSAMSVTTMRDIYMGNKVSSFYVNEGGAVVVNTTVQLLDTAQTRRQQVKDELQRQMSRAIQSSNNRIGDSLLFVQGSLNPVPGVHDLDECSDPSQHDCDENALCSNVFGSFICRCRPGYDDRYRTDIQLAGRYCESCTNDYCSDRGVCSIYDGEKTCECHGSYHGPRCDIDGEVLGAALGATLAAAVIIIVTFICLCKWSKRWHKGQAHNKVEMGTMGGASAYSFLKPSAAAAAHANFAMNMEERMRWAQIAEAMGQRSLYAAEPRFAATGRGDPAYGGVPLYASQPNLQAGIDGPASLNIHAGRSLAPHAALRAMTPVYTGGERTGRPGLPLPLPPGVDDDRSAMGVARPRSRGSFQRDFPTLSARGYPLPRQSLRAGAVYGPGSSAGSQQQLVYGPVGSVASSSTQQLYDARHYRSSSRDSIYETLSTPTASAAPGGPGPGGRPAPKDDHFEKSNSWRIAF